jgi:PAS domain S-box-containing protein
MPRTRRYARADRSAGHLLSLTTNDAFDRDALALAEQSAGIGVWTIDLTTGLVRATAQFFRIMGLEPTNDPVRMDVVRALRHPEDRDRVVAGFQAALDGGSDAYEIEYRIVRPDGSLRWIFGRGRVVRDAAGTPIRYSGIDLDITDRKHAQAELAAAKEALERLNAALEQRVKERTAELAAEVARRADAESRLMQAQKMEAVGQLTGGIAHDFNNILQVIVGNLEIARRLVQRPPSDEARDTMVKSIEAAQRAARNAAQTVHRLLAFSRLQPLSPTAHDANALIAEMADMIARTLGETIEVRTSLASDLWPVYADRHQLQTVLLNLVVNARDAMPAGGRLDIDTANVELDAAAAPDAPGDYVMLRVADSGSGIAPEHLSKVFDPFFSTKEPGKGSGLGLSMVYGFVRQSGGQVRIESEPGAGTAVIMYLPRCERSEVAAPPLRAAAHAHDALPRARDGETVLAVEDYDDARRLCAHALASLGYRVLEATDGASALAIAQSEPRIDLLFTDVVLPGGMSGRELADALRARLPRLPVLFATGYARDSIADPGALERERGVLGKPYTVEALANGVREAIDRNR